jgi:hypothetical protein
MRGYLVGLVMFARWAPGDEYGQGWAGFWLCERQHGELPADGVVGMVHVVACLKACRGLPHGLPHAVNAMRPRCGICTT